MPKYIKYKNSHEPENNTIDVAGVRFEIKANQDETSIDVYGAVGFDWEKWFNDEEQNDAQTLRRKLKEINTSKIVININSLGGDYNDGIVIHDLLKSHSASVETNVLGLTASAATLLMQAADKGKRRMSSNARILVHKASGFMFGWHNSNELISIAEDLEGFSNDAMAIYAKASGKDKEDYRSLMEERNGQGKWITAEEALEWGLIDEIFEPGEENQEVEKVENQNKQLIKQQLEAYKVRNLEAYLQT